MSLQRTKMDENNTTIFHPHPCFFLSVFPLSVAIFTGVSHEQLLCPRWAFLD